MDYQWQCGCDHILSTFTAHKCTVLPRQKTTKANRLVLYHACFAVPNATIASLCLCGVLTLFCNHKVSSCKLFGTLPYFFCSNELNCNRFLFYSLPCLREKWLCSCGHILSAFTAHKRTVIQAKAASAKSVGAVPCVFCCRTKNNCKPWGTVLRLIGDDEVSSCIFLMFFWYCSAACLTQL